MDSKAILELVLVVLGAVMTPASELQAADGRNLRLTRPMVVGGVYLRAAAYDYDWKFEGTHATVTFSRKGRAIATVQGEMSTLVRTAVNNTIYVSKDPDGIYYIVGLGFANTNKGIVFPVIQSRPRVATSSAADNLLLEDAWRNSPQPLHAVYR
jgi:hypothetical protein